MAYFNTSFFKRPLESQGHQIQFQLSRFQSFFPSRHFVYRKNWYAKKDSLTRDPNAITSHSQHLSGARVPHTLDQCCIFLERIRV